MNSILTACEWWALTVGYLSRQSYGGVTIDVEHVAWIVKNGKIDILVYSLLGEEGKVSKNGAPFNSIRKVDFLFCHFTFNKRLIW